MYEPSQMRSDDDLQNLRQLLEMIAFKGEEHIRMQRCAQVGDNIGLSELLLECDTELCLPLAAGLGGQLQSISNFHTTMMTVASSHNRATGQTERRMHHRVRAVFSEACTLIAPYLVDGGPTLSGFGLALMLRNHYPDLTDEEIHILVTAAMRYLLG